ncbi:MAG TPA: hypothetical protein VH479_04430 [Acidimicrobiales bacterium]
MILRRAGLGVAALLGAAILVAQAAPAAADPPRPSDYRSTVTGIDPAAAAVRAEIVGGDSFLELSVDRGHEVIVEGYGREPYLRFREDGTVERNRRSTATYLNRDRQGRVTPPPEADDDADPVWEKVASGGTYAWHDHRIHWMGTEKPTGFGPGDVIQDWVVSITVDGTPTQIKGTLVLAEEISPIPWFLLALLAGAAVLLLGLWRGHAVVTAGIATLAASLAALIAGWGQWSVAPPGSGVNPLVVVVPALGAVLAVAGLGLRGRRPWGPVATLASAAAVIGWGVLRADVLWKPVLPTDLPYNLDRACTALALGLSVAAAGLVVWSGELAFGARRVTAATAGGGDPQ